MKKILVSLLTLCTVTLFASNIQQTKKAFVLFYMSSCPHCRRFDPILKRYAISKHIPVLAYTLDNQSLPSFPDSLSPNGQEMSKFFPDGNPVVPTLFMIDLKMHQIVPVLTGEANSEQLSQRVDEVNQIISKVESRNDQ
jgi:type-F conjugative transfer system pilin assembly thiol-disulfide isomerase TrbB